MNSTEIANATRDHLRQIARDAGIKGWSGMLKSELVAAVTAHCTKQEEPTTNTNEPESTEPTTETLPVEELPAVDLAAAEPAAIVENGEIQMGLGLDMDVVPADTELVRLITEIGTKALADHRVREKDAPNVYRVVASKLNAAKEPAPSTARRPYWTARDVAISLGDTETVKAMTKTV